MHLAVLLPSLVVTVISAVPALTPETFPVESTPAIVALLDFHVTVLSVASAGKTVAVRVSFAPTTSDNVVLLSATLSGLITPPLLPILACH